ncbi:MAG TPA: SHOCT domain-containing protein [Gaiellaceae bacterium]|jgi:putative membrane protein
MNTLTSLIAGTSGGHHAHWWIVFPILWLLLFALALTFFWTRCRGRHDGRESPRRILGERFARGEINADEYRSRLDQLR